MRLIAGNTALVLLVNIVFRVMRACVRGRVGNMAGSLDIYPFHDAEGAVRFCVQVVIFLVGLFVTHKHVISPALRLHLERRKRTVGGGQKAAQENIKAEKLEKEYHERLQASHRKISELKAVIIEEARVAASTIVNQSQSKATGYVNEIQNKLEKEIEQSRKTLSQRADELASLIANRMGLALLVSLFLSSSFIFHEAVYAAENTSGVESFWYSVFWPYFQFVFFIVAAVFFARKPLRSILEKNRDELRARLSEAREALILAQRKVSEYEEKVSSLEKEISELKENGLNEARREGEKILAEATKSGEGILRDAERVAKELIIRGKEDIQAELLKMAFEKLQQHLSPEKLQKLDEHMADEVVDAVKTIH